MDHKNNLRRLGLLDGEIERVQLSKTVKARPNELIYCEEKYLSNVLQKYSYKLLEDTCNSLSALKTYEFSNFTKKYEKLQILRGRFPSVTPLSCINYLVAPEKVAFKKSLKYC